MASLEGQITAVSFFLNTLHIDEQNKNRLKASYYYRELITLVPEYIIEKVYKTFMIFYFFCCFDECYDKPSKMSNN